MTAKTAAAATAKALASATLVKLVKTYHIVLNYLIKCNI